MKSKRRTKWTSYFNPRPREEGDTVSRKLYSEYSNFNPRPREEGDHIARCNKWSQYTISIHALVKRATEEALRLPPSNFYFNPRPREEGDLFALLDNF